jgi:hypothetical protein
MQCSKTALLFDHLVGAQQDRSRQFNADYLGGPERLTDKANRKKAGDFGPVT